MITQQVRDEIMAREDRLRAYCVEHGFTNKRNGWTSYKPEQVAHLNPPTNEERSAVEVFDFCHSIPDRYFLYVKLNEQSSASEGICCGGMATATTFTGDRLGGITFGHSFRSNMGDIRVPITVHAINGKTYHGTYFKSSGDYARVKLASKRNGSMT